MADMLLDLVDHLKNEGLIVDDGVDVFRDIMPESPDKAVSLQEYPGQGTLKGEGTEGVGRAVQISARAPHTDPDWAHEKAWKIFSALCKPHQVIDLRPTGNFWGVTHAMQTPHKISVDENNRITYGFNMRLITYRDY